MADSTARSIGSHEGQQAVDGIAEEQCFVDACYQRLDVVTEALRDRMEAIGGEQTTGTEQDLLEKQALFDNLHRQYVSARAAQNRLCFGRVDPVDDRTWHIGRFGLRDETGDPLLIDWRAPTAAGFYQATNVEPMGLRRRRRIITKGRTVTHIEDEDLTDPTVVVGDAAASSVDAPREGRMLDIVATIAADQDRIVRSPINQVTVVQGAPGTGKTVVALHRAAWLLYTHRERLARDGVLVVGPSTAFLRYIDQVLPSLGETDVVLLTAGQLYPGVSTSLVDRPDVAAIKGDLVMVRVVSNAVRQRARVPAHDVTMALSDGSSITITAAQLADARRSVPRSGSFHSNREPFLRRALDHLSVTRVAQLHDDPDDADARERALADLVEETEVRRTLNLMWLPTTPERVIRRLLSDAEVLASAANGLLNAQQQQALLRPENSPWTVDDVPLLDEAAERLGSWVQKTPTEAPAHPDDIRELTVVDPFSVDRLTTTVAERAMDDRGWVYGHVVVDEAQELSRMAWHALARRCTRRSMTVVGDLQQAAHPAGARDWNEALAWVGERLDLHTLTVTYRITRQTAAAATELLTRAGGRAPVLTPIRDGEPAETITMDLGDLSRLIVERHSGEGGRVGVIVPDARFSELATYFTSTGPDFGVGDDALDAPVAVLTGRDAKGLEFDHVYVIDPDAVAAQGRLGSDIYVAATRATQQLHLVRS